jgi:hypothetical protein
MHFRGTTRKKISRAKRSRGSDLHAYSRRENERESEDCSFYSEEDEKKERRERLRKRGDESSRLPITRTIRNARFGGAINFRNGVLSGSFLIVIDYYHGESRY